MRVRRGSESGYSARLREDSRQLLLEALDSLERPRGPSFGELADAWIGAVERVCPENEERHLQHMEQLRGLGERELTVAEIDAAMRQSGLGPATQNKMRSTGKLVIDWAAANRRWTSPNPFALLRRRREPKRVYNTLSLDEACRVAQVVGEEPVFVRMVRVGLLTGARPGELAALRPSDVDLDRGEMVVRRSHERATTKTHRERRFAIPQCAIEPIHQALEDGHELLFPSRSGGRRGRNSKVSRRFGSLLDRAGVAHRVTFYDLRHTAATLHREAGADPLVIRLMLGHASRNLTDDLYTHLSVSYMSGELRKLCVCGKCPRAVV